jgi:hypothetical protein
MSANEQVEDVEEGPFPPEPDYLPKGVREELAAINSMFAAWVQRYGPQLDQHDTDSAERVGRMLDRFAQTVDR